MKIHLHNVKYKPDLDLEKIANMTAGMVDADLANLVNEAALIAVRRNKQSEFSSHLPAVSRFHKSNI